MNDNTTIAVIFVSIVLSLTTAVAVMSILEATRIKAGLEECVAHPGESRDTIWVKDCAEYTKIKLNCKKEK